MFAGEELIPTEAEKGLWYYQGINEVGNLYPDEATIADILGTGDLTPSADDDAELREADTVRQTMSSSHASHQQTTDGAGPSTVHVTYMSVPFAPNSVPTADIIAPARITRLRFVSSRMRGGHDAEQRSPVREATLDHLERRFTDVINEVEALWEEV
ncbi:hypothetical protein Q3G72_019879 [Acer saccharum]|nr:hypothetical protein Q3G72_019879 [Acer saccharum]